MPSKREEALAATVTADDIRQAFLLVIGYPAREADVQVVQLMGSTVKVLAEYMWDHWMGEPEGDRGLRKVETAVIRAVKHEAKSTTKEGSQAPALNQADVPGSN